MDRVAGYEPVGRGFESSPVCQMVPSIDEFVLSVDGFLFMILSERLESSTLFLFYSKDEVLNSIDIPTIM